LKIFISYHQQPPPHDKKCQQISCHWITDRHEPSISDKETVHRSLNWKVTHWWAIYL